MLHLLVPSPLDLHADMRSEKLTLLQQWRGKANAAAFGSSHVHNGFDPHSFDEVLASSQFPEKTINLGVEGGAQTEQRQLALRFVRQLQPVAGLQDRPLVLLELNAGANLTNDHLVHPRSINLYDWPTLRFAWQLVEPSMSRTQSVGRRGYALAAWMLHATNFGMVSSRIFPAPLDQAELLGERVDDHRGLWIPPLPPGREAKMAAVIARLSAAQGTQAAGILTPGNRLLAEELQRNSSDPNLQVAYFVTPKLSDLQSSTQWPSCIATQGGPVPILSMDNPRQYPDLYHDASNWTDDAHLTGKGAAILSRAMAEQLLHWETLGKDAAVAACGA